MSGNTEIKTESKNSMVKAWHIIAAATVTVCGILTAVFAESAGFIALIINLLCALHIVFPAHMSRKPVKRLAHASSTAANAVRISAIAIAVFVDVVFLI